MAKKDFNITGVLMALGGGFGANTVMNLAENNIQKIADNPKLAPLGVAALSTAAIYFTKDDKMDPLFYGMLGAAGGDLGDQLGIMEGFNRVNFKIDGYELNKTPLVDHVEKLMEKEKHLSPSGGGLSEEELFNFEEEEDHLT